MRRVILLLALAGAMPALAQTNITTCQTVSSAGTYVVQNDLTATGTCFTVSATSGTVTINLNGHTVTYGTASQINSVTAEAVTSSGGHSGPTPDGNYSVDQLTHLTQYLSSSIVDSEEVGNYLVNVTRISNTSGGANNYSYGACGKTNCTTIPWSGSNTQATCDPTHGFCRRTGIGWAFDQPTSGATYYVDYTYSTPVFFLFDSKPSSNTIVVLGGSGSTMGTIIEGAGGYAWDTGIYGNDGFGAGFANLVTVSNINFISHGNSTTLLGNQYSGHPPLITNVNAQCSATDTTYRDFYTGICLFKNITPSSGANTPQLVSNNYVGSFQQSGFQSNIWNTQVKSNVFHGTANSSNDVGINFYGENGAIANNSIIANSGLATSRGMDMGSSNTDVGFMNIDVGILPINLEYQGCELDGTTGFRFFDATIDPGGALTNLVLHDSTITVHASRTYNGSNSTCPAQGIDWVGDLPTYGSDASSNLVSNVTVNMVCDNACTQSAATESVNNGAGTAVTFNGYSHTRHSFLTINSDNIAIFMDNEGGEDELFTDCTINKTGTPFAMINAWPSTDSGQPTGTNAWITLQDCHFGTGVDPTTNYAINDSGFNFYYQLQNTYTVSVRNSTNQPVSGATVTFTDATSGSQGTATTDALGNATKVLPAYRRDWNSSGSVVGTATIFSDATHAYSISVAASGCTTLNYSSNIYQPHKAESKQLSGC